MQKNKKVFYIVLFAITVSLIIYFCPFSLKNVVDKSFSPDILYSIKLPISPYQDAKNSTVTEIKIITELFEEIKDSRVIRAPFPPKVLSGDGYIYYFDFVNQQSKTAINIKISLDKNGMCMTFSENADKQRKTYRILDHKLVDELIRDIEDQYI